MLALAVGFVQFAHKTHLFGGRATAAGDAVAAPLTPYVDVQAIANDLNRRDSRDDITCFEGGGSTPTALTCRASDGATWGVTVNSPPAGYTARIVRRSTFHQSAYFDAWSTVQSVRQCERLGSGQLPSSVEDQVGHVRLMCAGGALTQYLRPGNRVDYVRVGPKRFRIEVTASNGETVAYNSRTGAYSPPE